jgi:hypothetical protein
VERRIQENQWDHPQVPNQGNDIGEEKVIKRGTCRCGSFVSPSRMDSVTSALFSITAIRKYYGTRKKKGR